MPRNGLKSFPTAILRRGLAHFHPACIAPIQPPVTPPDPEPARLDVFPLAPPPAPSPPLTHDVPPERVASLVA